MSTDTPQDRGPSPLAGPSECLSDPLPADPMPTFRRWFHEAAQFGGMPNPSAMSLATVDAAGRPSVRTLLCKGFTDDGRLEFYTNRQSPKGNQLRAHPWASMLFHWDFAGRQVRFDGPVEPLSDAESDAYFRTRPWGRQIGAWASDQSQPIGSRAELEAKIREAMERFGLDPASPPPAEAPAEIPRPEYWGGYRLVAERVELWVAQLARLHDRAEWRRVLTPSPGPWQATRLQP